MSEGVIRTWTEGGNVVRPNKIKTAWEENRAAVNVFLSTPGSFTAEVMASLGWDGVTVDMILRALEFATRPTV